MIFPPYVPAARTPLDEWADIIMMAAFAVLVIFTLSYMIFFNWRKTSAGKGVMYFVLSLDAVFFLIVFGRLHGGDYPFRDVVRVVVYGLVLVATIGLLITLWKSWWTGAKLELKERTTGPIPTRRREKHEL